MAETMNRILCQNCTARTLSERQDVLEGRLNKERVLAKSKVKKAVKRVAKKAAPAAKTRSVKTAPPAKAVSKAKATPKAKKAANPAIAVVEPVPAPVPVKPVIAPPAAPVSAPKVGKTLVAPPKSAVASAPCDVLTVKRPLVSNKGVQRADLPPTEGFTLLVDGHFKNQYDDLDMVKAAASKLLGKFPKLHVEIYDAIKKTRTPI